MPDYAWRCSAEPNPSTSSRVTWSGPSPSASNTNCWPPDRRPAGSVYCSERCPHTRSPHRSRNRRPGLTDALLSSQSPSSAVKPSRSASMSGDVRPLQPRIANQDARTNTATLRASVRSVISSTSSLFCVRSVWVCLDSSCQAMPAGPYKRCQCSVWQTHRAPSLSLCLGVRLDLFLDRFSFLFSQLGKR